MKKQNFLEMSDGRRVPIDTEKANFALQANQATVVINTAFMRVLRGVGYRPKAEPNYHYGGRKVNNGQLRYGV